MHIIKLLPIVIIIVTHSQTAEYQNIYLDDWDTEKDWTPHFRPCLFFRYYSFRSDYKSYVISSCYWKFYKLNSKQKSKNEWNKYGDEIKRKWNK